MRRSDARLYRQHQLHLQTGTYRNDAFQPDWYPDPLIPFLNPITGETPREARFDAVPFDLPADETHAFWVDFYVPAHAVPGETDHVNVTVHGSFPFLLWTPAAGFRLIWG